MIAKSFDISDISELEKVADHLLKLVNSNQVLFVFNGDLGAGKTTLIKSFCKALSIQDNITSPTYAIINTYETNTGKEIYHFDFYRIENEEEAIQSGLDEIIDSGNICLMEWAEKISKLLPESYVEINISITGKSSRQIEIKLI